MGRGLGGLGHPYKPHSLRLSPPGPETQLCLQRPPPVALTGLGKAMALWHAPPLTWAINCSRDWEKMIKIGLVCESFPREGTSCKGNAEKSEEIGRRFRRRAPLLPSAAPGHLRMSCSPFMPETLSILGQPGHFCLFFSGFH